jgi:hypothetical protein
VTAHYYLKLQKLAQVECLEWERSFFFSLEMYLQLSQLVLLSIRLSTIEQLSLYSQDPLSLTVTIE